MRVRPVKVILGAFPNYLYSNQFQTTGYGTGFEESQIYCCSRYTNGTYKSFLCIVMDLNKLYNPIFMIAEQLQKSNPTYIINLKKMKLTTVKSQKQQVIKPISNVFKLKQMIQKAANAHSIQNKENISNNIQPLSCRHVNQNNMDNQHTNIKIPKMFKNNNFILSHCQRSKSEVSQKCQEKEQRQEKERENKNRSQNKGEGLKVQLSNMNLSKLKINPVLISSVKSDKSQKNGEDKMGVQLNKSKSTKYVSNKKIQGLSKSFRHITVMPKQQLNIQCFNLGRKLGKGRFGNVYTAQQKKTGFLLAIKIINKKQLKQSQMQQQLLSQIKLQTYMKHPNILQMYGYFHDHTNIYLMLQLAQDCLFKQLRRRTCYNEKQVAYFSKQIIQGLKYLHSQNIIHRDLKPENIMLVNNVIKLADFGWSVYSPLYKRQTFCGTLDYVPPQIVKGDFYDERVDIWSLGILIYELTFGFAPFQGNESQEATFQRIVHGDFQIPQHISQGLRNIITFILISDPKQRLNLKDIQESSWLRTHQMQGRSIGQEIWNFWQHQKLN